MDDSGEGSLTVLDYVRDLFDGISIPSVEPIDAEDSDSAEDGSPSRAASVATNLVSNSVSKAHRRMRIKGAEYLQNIQTAEQHIPVERERILGLLQTFADKELGRPTQEPRLQKSEAYAPQQGSIPWPPPSKAEGSSLPEGHELHRLSSAGIAKTRVHDIQGKDLPPLNNRPLGGAASSSHEVTHHCISSDTETDPLKRARELTPSPRSAALLNDHREPAQA